MDIPEGVTPSLKVIDCGLGLGEAEGKVLRLRPWAKGVSPARVLDFTNNLITYA